MVLGRPAFAVALFALVSTGIPQPSAASPAAPAPAARPVAARAASHGDPGLLDPADLVSGFRDAELGVGIVPPVEWRLSPAASLDRAGDDDLYEVARFQLRLRDTALYAQPLPATSGLLADAGAVLSLSLAREGSDLAEIDLASLAPDEIALVPGAIAIDSETSYDGVVTFTRTLVARGTGRTAVARAFVPAADRAALAPLMLATLATATVDASGPLGPRYVAPAPPPPPPAPEPAAEPAVAPVDTSVATRSRIVARAAGMLGTPYVWGGNAVGRGMDCSAFVSAAWAVSRYTTDSIWNVAVAIGKEQLLPGDALNLETWRDPTRRGHIRLFEAWANAEHTLVWVYEETPPRAIRRVIAYDDRYRPLRLAWLSGAGAAPLVPAPAAMPVPRVEPRPAGTRRPSATARPTVRPTARPTAKPTPKPSAKPTLPASAAPRPTARATASPSSPARPAPTPRPSAAPPRR